MKKRNYVTVSRESIKANLIRMANTVNKLNDAKTELGIDAQTLANREEDAMQASDRLDGAENLLGNAMEIYVLNLYETEKPYCQSYRKIRALKIEWSKDERPETVPIE